LPARQPDHADALHLLGVLEHQCGQHARAAELIRRAVARNPAAPAYHANLAEVYRALGRGDRTPFAREDDVEQAGSLVGPVLGNATPVDEYEPHAWGPSPADQIIAPAGSWHNPEVTQAPGRGH
jgi:glucose-6-phosphate 1-dehydrogenase